MDWCGDSAARNPQVGARLERSENENVDETCPNPTEELRPCAGVLPHRDRDEEGAARPRLEGSQDEEEPQDEEQMRSGLASLLLLVGCRGPGEPVRFGPDQPASLLVVIDLEMTAEQEERLTSEVISFRTSATGTWLRPGVRSLVRVKAAGHHAYAVTLLPSADETHLRALIAGTCAAAGVKAVLVNVIPDEVTPASLKSNACVEEGAIKIPK